MQARPAGPKSASAKRSPLFASVARTDRSTMWAAPGAPYGELVSPRAHLLGSPQAPGPHTPLCVTTSVSPVRILLSTTALPRASSPVRVGHSGLRCLGAPQSGLPKCNIVYKPCVSLKACASVAALSPRLQLDLAGLQRKSMGSAIPHGVTPLAESVQRADSEGSTQSGDVTVDAPASCSRVASVRVRPPLEMPPLGAGVPAATPRSGIASKASSTTATPVGWRPGSSPPVPNESPTLPPTPRGSGTPPPAPIAPLRLQAIWVLGAGQEQWSTWSSRSAGAGALAQQLKAAAISQSPSRAAMQLGARCTFPAQVGSGPVHGAVRIVHAHPRRSASHGLRGAAKVGRAHGVGARLLGLPATHPSLDPRHPWRACG